ncbi:MAG: YbbR-like domain-containing protein [Candidatus Aminicenantes bacterium]|nr:YbbR-like domain-containing protein [Candidatus Aminicenantes bacterium]
MKRFLKNLLRRNWELKLISFLLALVIWISFIPEEKIFTERTLTVPLEIYNIPSEMVLMEKPPSSIDVKIRAPQRLMSQINPAQVHTILNLENAMIDQQEYRIDRSMISIPVGAEVKDFYPSQVKLRLEMTKVLNLEVVPNLTGKLGEGLKLEKVEVIPSQIPVRGPVSIINENLKLRTYPFDISSLTQSVETELNVILPSPELKLTSSETMVKVRIIISQEQTNEENKKEIKQNCP